MSNPVFDNGEFARNRRTLQGELKLADLPRIGGEVLAATPIGYALAGGIDRLQRPTLDLALNGELQLKCQRCLKPVSFELDVATRFTLFADEARMNAAEADDEDLEGLLFEHEFALIGLIEDEILLSLPYAPAHDACEAGDGAAADAVATPQKPNPFAVLADLKGKLKRGEH
ncbi:YceD family protein [Chitinimonas koreensis]|uniref:YceD family protein n=1 Tax=Chitinimonas koreensis TaxID=356302 RepID=UPI0004229784|nr:YceD family protein [Chitinimonas koreensis]QNM97827.1 DUF177 domain-containing protein [Chitinimonas koreensis]